MRLIRATTKEGAQSEAMALGKKLETEYAVAGGDSVRWTFARVERLHEIDDDPLVNGTELFSRFLRESEVESLSRPFEDE